MHPVIEPIAEMVETNMMVPYVHGSSINGPPDRMLRQLKIMPMANGTRKARAMMNARPIDCPITQFHVRPFRPPNAPAEMNSTQMIGMKINASRPSSIVIEDR